MGKTTLARAVAKQRDSIDLDLETPRDQLKLRDPEGYLRLHGDKLIVLDEMQRSPDLFNILRGIIDENRQAGRPSGQFLILGIDSYDDLLSSPVLGKSWEGFVVENIHSVLPRRARTSFLPNRGECGDRSRHRSARPGSLGR